MGKVLLMFALARLLYSVLSAPILLMFNTGDFFSLCTVQP